LNLLDHDVENIDYISPSPYYSTDDINANISANTDNKFTVLSLNCQSLNAKFNKLTLFIERLKHKNIEFSAICFQETWCGEDVDYSLYQFENYFCISQTLFRTWRPCDIFTL
jgi:hypothetical protein